MKWSAQLHLVTKKRTPITSSSICRRLNDINAHSKHLIKRYSYLIFFLMRSTLHRIWDRAFTWPNLSPVLRSPRIILTNLSAIKAWKWGGSIRSKVTILLLTFAMEADRTLQSLHALNSDSKQNRMRIKIVIKLKRMSKMKKRGRTAE